MVKLFFMIVYNLTILLATGYVVFWKGASGWWFLLAVLLTVADFRHKN